MAVFYKYEYTHKTKNIHPCVIVEVVDLVIRRAADVMEEPCISLAVCEVGGEVVDRLAVAPLVERAVVSWAVKGHLGVDNIRWLLLLDVWVAGGWRSGQPQSAPLGTRGKHDYGSVAREVGGVSKPRCQNVGGGRVQADCPEEDGRPVPVLEVTEVHVLFVPPCSTSRSVLIPAAVWAEHTAPAGGYALLEGSTVNHLKQRAKSCADCTDRTGK